MISKKKLDLGLRSTVIGCGIQGGSCLAIAVRGVKRNGWRIEWGMYGDLDEENSDFLDRLPKKVWRRPFWAPFVDPGQGQSVVVRHVELMESNGKGASNLKKDAALKTQVMNNFSYPGEKTVLKGLELHDRHDERHLVGAVTRAEAVTKEYNGWRRDVGIINPHIGSNAAALANIYLALNNRGDRLETDDCDCMLVMVGRENAVAVLMRDWKLIDSIETPVLANQGTDSLIQMLIQHFDDNNSTSRRKVPLLLETDFMDSAASQHYDIWLPFEGVAVSCADDKVMELMNTHKDLAAVAFGMALQGG
jgi:hypothetical protein